MPRPYSTTEFRTEGFTPVSWRGGAGKEHLSVYERAVGRFCTLWPDKDSEGQGVTAMHNVALKLEEVGAEMICMIDVSEFEDGFDAAETNSETVLKLIGDPPLYEPVQKTDAQKSAQKAGGKDTSTPNTDDVFGVKGDFSFTNPRAMSSDGDAVRLLMLCPENLMVSLGEEDAASLFVCDSKTGVWSRSKILIGGAVTRSIELWQRKMYDDTLTQRQKDRVFSWSRSTRSELGRSHLQGSLPAALSIIQSEGKLTSLMEKGLVVCREEELNAEMRYIGTPNGVVDLEDGFLLTPAEAKKKLVTKSTRVEYKPMIHLEENEHASDVRGLMFHLSQEESDWIEGYIGHALVGES